MLTAPERPTASEVLAAVRAAWPIDATDAIHLLLGFGAHHWRIDGADGPVGFATVDLDTEIRPLSVTARAYRAAGELQDAGVPGVVAPIPALDSRYLVPLGGDGLSLTPWLAGMTPSAEDAAAHAGRTVELLRGVHTARPPQDLPRWSTGVPSDLVARVRRTTAAPWSAGPYGERARGAIAARADAIEGWAARHAELVGRAGRSEGWVPTHGEPHHANQMLVDDDLVLVDWESLRLAPPERDLLDVPVALRAEFGARDWAIALFELEWRLTEIAEYLDWFRRPHTGGTDDATAYEGLLEELDGDPGA